MPWREGDKVGPYIIDGQLGQGGMATVFKAHHTDLGRTVAIKVMHQTFQDDDTFRTRFQREARIVAGLEHPNIIPVFDYQEQDGQPYLVMKYVEGDTLKDRLKRGALPLAEILRILKPICEALTYAHSKGVLHRDIKPSNLILDSDGVPYIADFGLARIALAGESTISADVLLGTPHYISPEQARGIKDIDNRADIYSLGIVIYELFVGQVPFTAETPYAIVHDHIYTPLPSPIEINADITPEIESVILKATAKEPQDRYTTANALFEDLREAITDSKITELSADRATVAATSLAQMRNTMTVSGGTPGSIETPRMARSDREGAVPISAVRARNVVNARRWMVAGTIAFVLSCVATLGITLSAAGDVAEISDRIATSEAVSERAFLYDVPEMTLREAQQAVDESPEDPAIYLAAAKVAWETGADTVAVVNISRGLGFADDQARYLMTAAVIAADANQTEHAVSYALMAISTAGDDAEFRNQIRDLAGERIYIAATETDIEISDILAIVVATDSAAAVGENTAYALFFSAARQIALGELIRAERTVERLEEAAGDSDEVALLRAELELAQGETDSAIDRLTTLVETDSVIEWVEERAEELLDELDIQEE